MILDEDSRKSLNSTAEYKEASVLGSRPVRM